MDRNKPILNWFHFKGKLRSPPQFCIEQQCVVFCFSPTSCYHRAAPRKSDQPQGHSASVLASDGGKKATIND